MLLGWVLRYVRKVCSPGPLLFSSFSSFHVAVDFLLKTVHYVDEWQELFPFLFNGVKDGDSGLKKSCLSIFSSLTTYVEDKFLIPYLGVLREAFQFALGEQHDMEVCTLS